MYYTVDHFKGRFYLDTSYKDKSGRRWFILVGEYLKLHVNIKTFLSMVHIESGVI